MSEVLELCKCLEKSNNIPNDPENLCSRCRTDCEGLEWKWLPSQDSSAVLTSRGGSLITFHRRYSSGTAAVRGDSPFLPDRHYYWELQMCNTLYGTDIMVGVGSPNVDLDTSTFKFASLLGLDAESWGFSYTGKIQHAGKIYKYGPGFGLKDIVGVHVDMWYGTLSFFLNRKPLGIAFRGLRSHSILYPMVCSTAAQISMMLVKASSLPSSLFLHCSKALAMQPAAMRSLRSVPGMKYLFNEAFWLLLPNSNEPYYDDDDVKDRRESFGPFFLSSASKRVGIPLLFQLYTYKCMCCNNKDKVSSKPLTDSLLTRNSYKSEFSDEEMSPGTCHIQITEDIDINEVYANLSSNSDDEEDCFPGRQGPFNSRTLIGGTINSNTVNFSSSFKTPPCKTCRLKSALTVKDEQSTTNKCLECFYNSITTK